MADYFIEIRNPDDPANLKVRATIPYRLIEAYYKYDIVRWLNFIAVKHVLENTERIFAGVRRFNDGGWCFTGKPGMWYIRETVQVPFPKGLVFAVYLNPRFFVYEARAERVAFDDEFSPIDWQNRYKTLIWKNTS
jgi:hypothetical protein